MFAKAGQGPEQITFGEAFVHSDMLLEQPVFAPWHLSPRSPCAHKQLLYQGLQAAQQRIAAHLTKTGLEAELEAAFFGIVPQLTLASFQRRSYVGDGLIASSRKRRFEHRQLHRPVDGNDIVCPTRIKRLPAGEIGDGCGEPRLTNIGARAMPCVNSSQAFEYFERLADGRATRVEHVGQVTVAGEPVSRGQTIRVSISVIT